MVKNKNSFLLSCKDRRNIRWLFYFNFVRYKWGKIKNEKETLIPNK